MNHRTDTISPWKVDQSSLIARRRRNLGSDAEVGVVRLETARRRKVIDVLHHIRTGHSVAAVSDWELVDSIKVICDPVDVPNDLAGRVRLPQDRLDGILRKFAKKLQLAAVAREPIQQEASMCDGKEERARRGGGIAHGWSLPKWEVGVRPLG